MWDGSLLPCEQHRSEVTRRTTIATVDMTKMLGYTRSKSLSFSIFHAAVERLVFISKRPSRRLLEVWHMRLAKARQHMTRPYSDAMSAKDP